MRNTPPYFLQTIQLKELDLSCFFTDQDQKLTEIPLDLTENILRELPNSLDSLSNLEYLSLDFNQLRELPESINRLINLIQLDLT